MPSPTDRGPAARRYRCARGHFLPAGFSPPATDPDDWDDECRCKPQTISIKEPTVTGRQIALDTQPRRIQRRHTKGWRAPAKARYVGRGTRWGNPWVVAQTRTGWAVNWAGEGTPTPEWTASTDNQHAAHVMAVGLYREYAERTVGFAVRARVELAGRDLMRWCPPELPCHVDVLLAIANPTE